MVQSWAARLPKEPFDENMKALVLNMFEKYVDKGLEWLRKNGMEPVGTQDAQVVLSLTKLFESLFNSNAATAHGCTAKDALGEAGPLKPFDTTTLEPKEFEKFLLPSFCFAYCWSIGSTCDGKTKVAFQRELENWFD